MPFAKKQGAPSQIDQKLKTRRQKIIEEERIRVLKESLLLFYEKLMEKYELIHLRADSNENEDIQVVDKKEIESFSKEYSESKPLGF